MVHEKPLQNIQSKLEDSAQSKQRIDKRVLMIAAFIVIVVGGGIGGFAYYAVSSQTIYIDKAQLSAPVVTLSPTTSGLLRAVYVKEGDVVAPNTVVAQVGVELIKSTAGGLVISTNDNIGKQVSPQDSVVSMIDPGQLRVVGEVQEDKGFSQIHVGQSAEFTVDAFGSKTFSGVVDEISPTAQSSDVVFSVSDKRQEQSFDVKVRFDRAGNPNLKNGMSAKLWIYKQ